MYLLELNSNFKRLSLLKKIMVNLIPFSGNAFLKEDFYSEKESKEIFRALSNEIQWKQEPIKIMGKEIMQPRLTAWYGEEDHSYTYSGITMKTYAWSDTLLKIKERLYQALDVNFTNVLLNLYRNQTDGMGWHRDNEKELGPQPTIASLSFGEVRKFQFRSYHTKTNLINLHLASGSLLLMKGETNYYWEHRIPKTAKVLGPRINLTFRIIQKNK